MFCGLILAAVGLLDVSCATIMLGDSETLVVESRPTGANVALSNGMVGKTPASFEVPRAEKLIVRIGKDGYDPIEVSLTPVWADDLKTVLLYYLVGNLFQFPGMLVDVFSDALYDLEPNPVRVWLRTSNPDTSPIPGDGLVKGSGTGFFITDDGYFLTAYHVVENAAFVEVVTDQGKKRARVIRIDPVNDLAVLKVEGQFSALPLISSKDVELGDSAFTVGFPLPGIQGVSPKLTKGSINSLAGIRDNARVFQISVPIQPGNSGGPLVDDAGNVTGIVVSSLGVNSVYKRTGTVPQLVNYAVKSSYALELLESLAVVQGKLKEPFPTGESEDRSANQKRALAATFRVLVIDKDPRRSNPAP